LLFGMLDMKQHTPPLAFSFRATKILASNLGTFWLLLDEYSMYSYVLRLKLVSSFLNYLGYKL
jgi:hypothetical protein